MYSEAEKHYSPLLPPPPPHLHPRQFPCSATLHMAYINHQPYLPHPHPPIPCSATLHMAYITKPKRTPPPPPPPRPPPRFHVPRLCTWPIKKKPVTSRSIYIDYFHVSSSGLLTSLPTPHSVILNNKLHHPHRHPHSHTLPSTLVQNRVTTQYYTSVIW